MAFKQMKSELWSKFESERSPNDYTGALAQMFLLANQSNPQILIKPSFNQLHNEQISFILGHVLCRYCFPERITED